MTWYAWVLVIWITIDRLANVALIGRYSIEITREYAVASLITGALVIWAIVSLAAA